MKWKNRGHELDSLAYKLIHSLGNKQKKIYIFGAGLIGMELRATLKKTGYFAGFIDNNKMKQSTGVDGACVISLKRFQEQGENGVIIIAADKKNIPVIAEQLCNAGLKKGKDFYPYTEFMEQIFPLLLFYEKGMLYVELVQICLTERCSLKCKKCAHGCYAVDMQKPDLDIEIAKQSADVFFKNVDIVREFVLIGGEPFLYKNLSAIIAYIGDKYRNKIIVFSITTHGTIIPQQDVLNMCKKYNVLIRISNYSASIERLKEKYVQIRKKLDENHIAYVMADEEHQWIDYGFETVERNWDENDLIQVFDKCRTPCREVRGDRYYYCVMARSVSENLGFGVGEEDYFDLGKLNKKDKKILLEFQLGYSEKGYLDMCNYCNGAEAVNFPIPAAEQI